MLFTKKCFALVPILSFLIWNLPAQVSRNLNEYTAAATTFVPVVVSPSPATAAFDAVLASWLDSQTVSSSTKDVLTAFRAKLNGGVFLPTDVNDLFSVLSQLESKNAAIEDMTKVLATFTALSEYGDPTTMDGLWLNLTQIAEGKAEAISSGIDTATRYFKAAARFATR